MYVVRVNRTLFENPETGFLICQASLLEGTIPSNNDSSSTIVIKGFFPKNTSVELEVDGNWENSTKYGYQLNVQKFKERKPKTQAGILKYFSSYVHESTMREDNMKRIVSHFKANTFDVFDHSPEKLLNLRGVRRGEIDRILEEYHSKRVLEEVTSALVPFGITHTKCARIISVFGCEAMRIVKDEPYRLCDVEGFGFVTVERIAHATTFNCRDALRIRAAIKYVLQVASTEGHLCLPQKELLAVSYLLLNGDEDCLKTKVKKVVDEFVKTQNITLLSTRVHEEVPISLIAAEMKAMALCHSLKGDNSFAYLPDSYNQEVECANILSERLKIRKKQFSEVNIRKEITKFEASIGIKLAGKQVEAVIAGVNNNTCIVTGGPGVGKTTVLKMILSVCQKLENLSPSDVTLLAPTGRAAQRMCESVGVDYSASTIHSCLCIGADGQGDIQHIDSKIVVVDESSMVDQYIFWCLLKAISNDTKLIIIGDAEQLPSVGAGNVLFELLKCGVIPTVRLDVIFRQSGTSSIVVNSDLIRRGIPNLKRADDFSFFPVSNTSDYEQKSDAVQKEAAKIVVEQYLKAVKDSSIDDVQVLCPMRKEGVLAGAAELNKAIQHSINPSSPDKPELQCGKTVFRVNDKVILTKNNYDLEWQDAEGNIGYGLFNGDVGYIKKIDKKNRKVLIDFAGKQSILDITQMHEISLAYAISIHKSQGSEYRTCIIPIINQFFVMLKRNLIYTGITRAKKNVILIGHDSAIRKAVETNVISNRYTQLGDRIKNNVK